MPQDPIIFEKMRKMQAAQTALEAKGQIPSEKAMEWALLEIAMALDAVQAVLSNIYSEQIRAATHPVPVPPNR
jgi:hypothetical protein